jgi:hypothetical protein
MLTRWQLSWERLVSCCAGFANALRGKSLSRKSVLTWESKPNASGLIWLLYVSRSGLLDFFQGQLKLAQMKKSHQKS